MKTDNLLKPEIKCELDDDGVYRMKGVTPEIKLAIEKEYNELLKVEVANAINKKRGSVNSP